MSKWVIAPEIHGELRNDVCDKTATGIRCTYEYGLVQRSEVSGNQKAGSPSRNTVKFPLSLSSPRTPNFLPSPPSGTTALASSYWSNKPQA